MSIPSQSIVLRDAKKCDGRRHCGFRCLCSHDFVESNACRTCELGLRDARFSSERDAAPIEIRVNGERVVCRSGAYLADVLCASGHPVPMLCRHPKMPPIGACRVCIVEVLDADLVRVVSSCDYQVLHPISVQTDTPRILRHREMIFGFLLSEAPDAEILHASARMFHIATKPLTQTAGNAHGCILCGRCVLACQTFAARPALEMCGRSKRLRPAFAFDREISEDCDRCGACAAVCPTGARGRVVDLSPVSGPLCNFCSFICPEAAISISPNRGEFVIEGTRCKECGLCVHYCPQGALRVESSCDR